MRAVYDKGFYSKARLDQAVAAAKSAESAWKAGAAAQAVVTEQAGQGQVLAPAAGRVVRASVPAGSVVMPGDVMVGDGEGVVCVPRGVADEVAEKGLAQEELEAFVLEKVKGGVEAINTDLAKAVLTKKLDNEVKAVEAKVEPEPKIGDRVFLKSRGLGPYIVIGDVGQDRFEEVDYETLAGARGANFGWNDFEGNSPFGGAIGGPPSRHDRPIKVYSLGGSAPCALIGGFVSGSKKLKSIRGRYVYGDFCVGKLRSFVPSLKKAKKDRGLGVTVQSLSSFGLGPGGSLYAASLNGPVYKLVGKRK